MTEPDEGVDIDQSRALRRPSRVWSEPKSPGCTPQQANIAQRLRRCNQQESLGFNGKHLEPSHEDLLDAVHRPHRIGQGKATRSLRRPYATCQIEQNERVTV